MKLGKYTNEEDLEEMSDEHLEFQYYELIQDPAVANAVMAVLLKLEIERRRTEILRSAAESVAMEEGKV